MIAIKYPYSTLQNIGVEILHIVTVAVLIIAPFYKGSMGMTLTQQALMYTNISWWILEGFFTLTLLAHIPFVPKSVHDYLVLIFGCTVWTTAWVVFVVTFVGMINTPMSIFGSSPIMVWFGDRVYHFVPLFIVLGWAVFVRKNEIQLVFYYFFEKMGWNNSRASDDPAFFAFLISQFLLPMLPLFIYILTTDYNVSYGWYSSGMTTMQALSLAMVACSLASAFFLWLYTRPPKVIIGKDVYVNYPVESKETGDVVRGTFIVDEEK